MILSYVILTHNRRDSLLHTLEQLKNNPPLAAGGWETWVVDNGSTDGTTRAVADTYPHVNVIHRAKNEGVWARQYAIDRAGGKYIGLLDDDSYPIDDATTRSIRFLEAHPQAASVTGAVVLSDGSYEASALPAVPANGGLCIRRSALQEAGGLRPCRWFERQVEEYDMAFRLLEAGYSLHRFEDVVYRHDKAPGARSTASVHRLDVRNNLIVAYRYLPKPLRQIYQEDWLLRYFAIAKAVGFERAVKRGRWQAMIRSAWESLGTSQIVSSETIEAVFDLDRQAAAVADWAATNNIQRVVIAGFSKNIYATYRACMEAGLRIVAIADDNPAFRGMVYRGIEIETYDKSLTGRMDGVVLSNINPAQVDGHMHQLEASFDGPILRLWHSRYLKNEMPMNHLQPTLKQSA